MSVLAPHSSDLPSVIVLVVFGPGRLPEVMGNLGKGMQEFKKGLREPPEIEKAPETDEAASKSRREG